MPNEFYGYFGWPTITRMPDGTLVAASSGLRNGHVCPFGRSVILISQDDGQTWTEPRVVNDTPLDDRDTGILALGDRKLLLSWFTTDHRKTLVSRYDSLTDPVQRQKWYNALAWMTDTASERWAGKLSSGSWVRFSPDGGETWADPVKVAVNANHGPIQLRSGRLVYFGRRFVTSEEWTGTSDIATMTSDDEGRTWTMAGSVPLYPGTDDGNYHEPHVVETQSGKLIGMIRVQNMQGSPKLEDAGVTQFSLAQTESLDGGQTWSTAEPLNFHGSPPHLLAHSSGALVCVYGYRLEGYGQRAMISYDEGKSWTYDYVLRDDGPDHDLGYPSSVELADGSILTMYYQKPESVSDQCALLWTRWTLPEA